MERDSFEHAEVAAALKGRFIAIKVDREERPDVDAIYMDAVVGLNGHGGWPMSVFLTPDLKPFWGGTFFPRAQFLKVLDAISAAWSGDRSRVSQAAEQITASLSERNQRHVEGTLSAAIFEGAALSLGQAFDREFGGFSAAPKFPPAEQCRFLLRYGWASKRDDLIAMAAHTLDAMSRGGIYDHLGGGFSRYSVDRFWLVPHFEKMLYDNALLVPAYLEAFQITKRQQFAEIAQETLNYLLRDLHAPKGGFYSAQDAGDVGKEGEYYVWRYDQLAELLEKDELEAISTNTLISEQGNFEHAANVLAFKLEADWANRSSAAVRSAFHKLFAARNHRNRPGLDTKIISAWNGFVISALGQAARVLQNESYSRAAKSALEFIQSELLRDAELLRCSSDGVSAHHGCLEDYAALIDAALCVYQISGDRPLLSLACTLQDLQDRYFWIADRGLYRFSKANELPIEQFDQVDGATPSGNSLSLKNLAVLELLVPGRRYGERFEALSSAMAGLVMKYPHAVCKALEGLAFKFSQPFIITLPKQAPMLAADIMHLLSDHFLSPLVICWDDSTKAHICCGTTCGLPTENLDDLRIIIERWSSFMPSEFIPESI